MNDLYMMYHDVPISYTWMVYRHIFVWRLSWGRGPKCPWFGASSNELIEDMVVSVAAESIYDVAGSMRCSTEHSVTGD